MDFVLTNYKKVKLYFTVVFTNLLLTKPLKNILTCLKNSICIKKPFNVKYNH